MINVGIGELALIHGEGLDEDDDAMAVLSSLFDRLSGFLKDQLNSSWTEPRDLPHGEWDTGVDQLDSSSYGDLIRAAASLLGHDSHLVQSAAPAFFVPVDFDQPLLIEPGMNLPGRAVG